MKKYIGTKEVLAEPMNELEAINLGYARVNDDEHEMREGYHVRYKDGYNSWSPLDVFDESYQCSESYLDRLIIEHNDLILKLTKLECFLNTEAFKELAEEQQHHLMMQCHAMNLYLFHLSEIIKLIRQGE